MMNITTSEDRGNDLNGKGKSDGREKRLVWEEWVVGSVLCTLVILVAIQVLSRYVLHQSLSYTEEIVRYGFVWITFIGASVAAYRGRHLSLGNTTTHSHNNIYRIGRMLSFAGAVLFSVVLIVFGSRVVILQMSTGQRTAVMGLPMWIFGLAVPVCAALMLVRIVMAVWWGKERR